MTNSFSRAFDPTVMLNTDLTMVNPERAAKDYLLLFNYGANMTVPTLLSRLLADWQGLTIEKLESHFLGIYKIPNMAFAFNKSTGTTSRANIFVQYQQEVYGTICAIPKAILYDANSNLNRAEGCSGVISERTENAHYWIRQLPEKAIPVGDTSRHPTMENGGKDINQGIWFYQATPTHRVAPGEELAPPKDYASKILAALESFGCVPNDYLDKIRRHV